MKRPIALATICLLIFAAVHTPRRLQLHHRFHSPARRRLPPTQPLESHTRLALESPLEHLPPAHQHHDPHSRRSRHARATRRNRAIHLRLLRSVDRRPRHHLQHRSPPWPHRSPHARHPRKFLHERSKNNADGLNTICFNQSSSAFTTGVLAFTRVITANAPGVSAGASGPASFAGQILDADTLFRNDNQATYATPAALATPQGQGAYDLESLLAHELGHWFGPITPPSGAL
jgi:hypothetical protein